MLHIRHGIVLRTVLFIAALSLQACAQSASPAPRPSQPPPADITALYGNTVEIIVEVSANPKYEHQHWYYVVNDGSRILESSGQAFEGENRGTTFGRDERICVEQKRVDSAERMILCGSFSVQGHIVTMNFDMKSWDTERLEFHNGQSETVFSVDGARQCSFLGRRSVWISDLGTTHPVSNTGSCRILEDRHLDAPRALTRE